MSADPAPVVVPVLGQEQHVWQAEPDGMTSRARVRAASGEYTSALTPPIADLDLALPPDLAADAE